MYPIEWPLNVVGLALMDNPVGSLYLADYSLYVRDIGEDRTESYSASWVGVWSPDSRWIACGGPKKHEQVPLMLIDTDQRTELLIPNPDAPRNWALESFAWSQDSQVIFFKQQYAVYAFDLLAEKLVRIAQDLKDSDVDVLKIGMKRREKAEQVAPADVGNHSAAGEPHR